MRKAGKAGLAPPQGRHARQSKNRLQSRILLHQRMDRGVEISLRFEVDRHFAGFSRSLFIVMAAPAAIHVLFSDSTEISTI
jgi:hypothetical protein